MGSTAQHSGTGRRPGGYCFLMELSRSAVALGQARSEAGQDDRFVPGEYFELAHAGKWHSRTYGEIEITPDDLATMHRNWKNETVRLGGELPMDYDHLGDNPQKPGDGRAAGWIEDLQLRDGGRSLWAKAKWTKPAAKMIAAGEYRFVSPYFLLEGQSKRTGKGIGPFLRAAAITNRPFLEGQSEIPAPAIAASDTARVAVLRESHGARRLRPGAVAERRPQRPPRGDTAMSTEKKDAEIALDDQAPEMGAGKGEGAEPGLTCPHCGAPVKHHAAKAEEMAEGEYTDKGKDGASDDDADDAEMTEMPKDGAAAMSDQDGAADDADADLADPKARALAQTVQRLQGQVRQMGRALSEVNLREKKRASDERRQLAETLLKQGLKSGRITAADSGTREKPGWARTYAFTDPAGFKAMLGSAAKPKVDMEEHGSSDDTAANSAAQTAEQVNVLALAEQEKSGGKLSYAEATKKVLAKPENVALAERYADEMIGERKPATAGVKSNVRRLG